MRKRYRIVLVVLLVAIVGGVAWLASRPREPVYQGKPLSFWLGRYQRFYRDSPDLDPLHQEADEAVRYIGTNAIPFLLRMIRAHDSPLKLELIELASRQRLLKVDFVSAERLNVEAVEAFGVLGSSASNAVPELIKIYSQNIPPGSQFTVVESLGRIGPAASKAVPMLLLRAGNTNVNEAVREHALRAIERIHSEPGTVVPALIRLLREKNSRVQSAAADALKEFGPDARPAVGLLIECYNNAPDYPSRYLYPKVSFYNALQQIDPEAAAKAGVK